MRIGLTGATGLVGRHSTKIARESGHEVVAFTRDPANPVPGCIETRAFSTTEAMDLSGVDAVVHLAGESVFGLWTFVKKKAIRNSRTQGTKALVESIGRLPADKRPKVLVSASAIGFYGSTGDAKLTEETAAGTGFLPELAQAWEAEAFRARELGVRVVTLRIGLVLAKDSPAIRKAVPAFKARLGGKLGSGRQWMSWIHIRDLSRMILLAIENPKVSGPWNATAPVPVRNSEFTGQLAWAVRRPAVIPIPAFLLKIALGEMSSVLLDGQRVIPRKALDHGFEFTYTDIASAFADCV